MASERDVINKNPNAMNKIDVFIVLVCFKRFGQFLNALHYSSSLSPFSIAHDIQNIRINYYTKKYTGIKIIVRKFQKKTCRSTAKM